MSGAPLDWLQTYAAAQSGSFGDQSERVMRDIEKDNDKYNELVKRGVISSPHATHTVSNESGSFEVADTSQNNIDWSQLPKMGPPGYNAPKGTMWESLSTDGSVGAIGDQGDFAFYDDPNYGRLGLRRTKGTPDGWDKYGFPIAISLASGMMAAPAAAAIGASMGFGALGTNILSAGIKTGVSSVVGGHTPNVWSLMGSFLKPNILSNFPSIISSTPTTTP